MTKTFRKNVMRKLLMIFFGYLAATIYSNAFADVLTDEDTRINETVKEIRATSYLRSLQDVLFDDLAKLNKHIDDVNTIRSIATRGKPVKRIEGDITPEQFRAKKQELIEAIQAEKKFFADELARDRLLKGDLRAEAHVMTN